MRKLTLSTILVFAALFSMAQAKWIYTSPVDGAKFAGSEQIIVLRCNEAIDASTLTESQININGSETGLHSFDIKILNDGRTINIKTNRKFAYNETIEVKLLHEIRTLTGQNVSPVGVTFKVMKEDNSYLRAEYEQYILEGLRDQGHSIEISGDTPAMKSTKNNNLPEDFPELTVTVNKSPAPGYVFVSPNNPFAPPTDPFYVAMLDRYGTPVYYKKIQGAAADFKIQENGMISHFLPSQAGGLGIVYGSHLVYNSHMTVVDTFQMQNGHLAEIHDFLLFENGHSAMFTYDPQIVDMSELVEGGDPAATVMGFIMQELDAERNVVFEWSSWDHIPITDAVADVDLTGIFIDYCHGNSIELDNDGNYIISFRHTDEVIKVSRETGEFLWRMNAYNSEINDFDFTNDTIKFSHQHDARRLENGNISIFDNGNLHWGPYSRVVEYEIDEENLTATQVWSYPEEPGHYDFAFAMGGAQRFGYSNHTMIGWGIAFYPMKMASEVTMDHETTWEIWAPLSDTLRTYRAYKYDWSTDLFSFSKDTIDYGEYTGYNPEPYILQVTNNSSQAITLSGTHNHQSAFSISSGIPSTIEAGATGQVIVSFFPSSPAQFDDLLTIYCDLGDDSKIAKQVVLKGWTADEVSPQFTATPENGSEEVSRLPVITFTANERLYNTSGEELSQDDLIDLISFNEMITKEEIPFFAEITWMETKETRIKIMPVDSLGRETMYNVSLAGNMLQDWTGNMVTEVTETSFKTENFAGISDNPVLTLGAYPNPATESINIELPYSGLKQIELFDLSGRILGKTQSTEKSFSMDVSYFEKGIYFVKVRFENGQTGTSKVIVK